MPDLDEWTGGQTTFRMGRTLSALLLFFPGLGLLGVLVTLGARLKAGDAGLADSLEYLGIVAGCLWIMTAGRWAVRATLGLGPKAIAIRSLLRTRAIPWGQVAWVWIGNAGQEMPQTPRGPDRRSAPPGAAVAGKLGKDSWVVVLGDGLSTRLVVGASNLYEFDRARPVLARYLRENVDRNLIEDRIGLLD